MAFTNRTFELLSELEDSGKYSFYKENEEEFKKQLVLPFRKLILEGVIPNLPDEIVNSLETQEQIFGKVNKNDFGKGGANAFYWAALSPKKSSKQQDVQLLAFINCEYIEFGFFFGHRCSVERQENFASSVRQLCESRADYEMVLEFLSEQFPEDTLLLRDADYKIDGEEVMGYVFTWRDYFEAVKDEPIENIPAYSPMIVHSRETVLGMSEEELATEISTVFEGLFPLVILASHSDPLPILRAYLADWK